MGRYLQAQSFNSSIPHLATGVYPNATITVNVDGFISDISSGSAGVADFNDLSDVTLTGPIANQIIQFNGSDWVNVTPSLSINSDVSLSSPTLGQYLTYDGADWVNTTLDALVTADIGVTVQAWDALLDSVSGLSGTGYIVQTAAGTVANRTITGSDGIIVTDGNGVSANTDISVTINTLPFNAPIDPSADLLMFYNFDVGNNQQASIEDIVLSATPIINATSIGSGADVYKDISSQVLEFRSISSASVGVTVTELANDIQISLSSNLSTISSLTPNNDSFIVGNGTSWTVEDAATARTSLGLGTMALEDAADYLPVAGGTMTGAIAMSTNKITGLGEPSAAQDAATKNYVDTNLATAGDGLTKTGNEIDVVNNDGSITVLADEILINSTWLDNHTDALYYTQTQLGDTTNGSEGASLIGTDAKTGLGGATNIEDALEAINTDLPYALVRFRQDISVWNLDITTPTATRAIVNNVEVARFADGENDAVYKDLLLPYDYDDTKDLKVYVALAKQSATAGNIVMALAWQQQRTPGFSANSSQTFIPGAVTDVGTISWTIPAGTFQALDVMTLRLTRLGTDVGDTYTASVDLFAANVTQ